MKNPERVNEPTPNGGTYSEMWYFDKDGEVAKSKETATNFRILEKDKNGNLIQTTYGMIEHKVTAN